MPLQWGGMGWPTTPPPCQTLGCIGANPRAMCNGRHHSPILAHVSVGVRQFCVLPSTGHQTVPSPLGLARGCTLVEAFLRTPLTVQIMLTLKFLGGGATAWVCSIMYRDFFFLLILCCRLPIGNFLASYPSVRCTGVGMLPTIIDTRYFSYRLPISALGD